ncbi:hypothetical protein BGZ79_004505 [Entomortierella chlamydospora]|nr:hypothetical protein BGZ79_004505 [Entomortierella chlamydospora]
MSSHPIADDIRSSTWTSARKPSADTSPSTPTAGTTRQQSGPVVEDKLATGAKGTDPDNNSNLDSTSTDYNSMTLSSLRRSIRGTILDIPDDLQDASRPIRPKSVESTSKSYPEHKNEEEVGKSNSDEDEEQQHEEIEIVEEDANAQDEQSDQDKEQSSEDTEDTGDTAVEEVESEDTSESEEFEEFDPDQELGIQDDENEEGIKEEGEQDIEDDSMMLDEESQDEDPESQFQEDTSLADFDSSQTLSTNDSYLVFVPYGETIEAQYFTLLTSLWIAKHSNRTLIIPPPMMAPPSLHHLYPFFAGPNGKKPQRWSHIYDLRHLDSQPVVMVDNIRPILQTPFTDEMAKEEENPTTNHQETPHNPDIDSADTTLGTIKCHGPPAAGSWKTLDFAGRHFLNRYNLVADFNILEDSYWDLRPHSIQQNWQASRASNGEEQEDRQRQLICITGVGLVGAEDPEVEEMIWNEIGTKVPVSKGVRNYSRLIMEQALRAIEKSERKTGYIGIHIDKLPSPELCKAEHNDQGSYVPSFFTEARASGLVPSQCAWTVELVAKRIAIIQQTDEAGVRPVIVTTTETDPGILIQMDRQGWVRMGVEDHGGNLFDMSINDLGGYGLAVSRAFLMAKSAVFVGAHKSMLAVHTAFHIKNEGQTKLISGRKPRWELY